MKVLVIGATKAATALIDRLVKADRATEVVLVDKDRAKLERLAEDHDCGMVVGDGTAPGILKEACGDTLPDLLVALTDSDQMNLIAAMLGRCLEIPRVLPKITAPELEEAARFLSLDTWIAPEALIASEVERIIGLDLEGGKEGAESD